MVEINKRIVCFIHIFILYSGFSILGLGINQEWNTFLGRDTIGPKSFMILSNEGFLIFTGAAGEEWGNPIRKRYDNLSSDSIVVKLDKNGRVRWHTYLGGEYGDESRGITTDKDGNIYVLGISRGPWGNPIEGWTGGSDIYVAKLSSNGQLLWVTFLGSKDNEDGGGIVVGKDNNVYIVGTSGEPWGFSEHSFPGSWIITVAKLSADGELLWNTFLGSGFGTGIEIDKEKNIFIAGHGSSNWGSPINPIVDWGTYAFAAKLDNNGKLIWNNFFGGGGNANNKINDLLIDKSKSLYLLGTCVFSWGNPVRAYEEHEDIIVIKVDSKGNLNWHTYLGGAGGNRGYTITKSESGGIYIGGSSTFFWGYPIFPFSTTSGINVIKLKDNGWPVWNTFIHNGYCSGIVVDQNEKIFISGSTQSSWGNPIIPFGSVYNFFIAKIFETDEESKTEHQLQAYAHPGGFVDPVEQVIKGGETGKINIICDDGYFVDRIIDNDLEKTISNPYYIYNVNENHHVEVFFEKIKYPPTIKISGEIHEEKSWIIKKNLLKIDISIEEHDSPMDVLIYRLYKSIPTGNIKWFDISKEEGDYTFVDNDFPENEEVYYYVCAIDDRLKSIAQSDYLIFNKKD